MSDALPLFLTLDQTRALLVAVEVTMKLDGAALMDVEARQMAEEQVQEHEGPAGVARIDQTLSAARDRYPILSDLRSALYEHIEALEHNHPA